MNLEETTELLGVRGQLGVVLLVLGVLVIARIDRKAAVGTVLVVSGLGLVAGGIVDTALEKMGMKGAF
jgi:small-conductance mechanosensitive channel